MIEEGIKILNILVQIATLISLIFVVCSLLESKKSRIISSKPILIPSIIDEINSENKIFAYNFSYPVQEFEFHGIAYIVIENIGKGAAVNVQITSIETTWETIKFTPGKDNSSIIKEGSVCPIIFRLGFDDEDLSFGRIRVSLSYEDIMGELNYVSYDIWLKDIPKENNFIYKGKVINYSIAKKKIDFDTDPITFRNVENAGFYELETIKLKKN